MLLLKVSAHITEQLGMAPGGEFREAFKEVGIPLVRFIPLEVDSSLLWSAMPFKYRGPNIKVI